MVVVVVEAVVEGGVGTYDADAGADCRFETGARQGWERSYPWKGLELRLLPAARTTIGVGGAAYPAAAAAAAAVLDAPEARLLPRPARGTNPQTKKHKKIMLGVAHT